MSDSRKKRPRDPNQLAKLVVDLATGEVDDVDNNQREQESVLTTRARKGGEMGGVARAKALSPERRTEIAKAAAAARWGKYNGGPDE